MDGDIQKSQDSTPTPTPTPRWSVHYYGWHFFNKISTNSPLSRQDNVHLTETTQVRVQVQTLRLLLVQVYSSQGLTSIVGPIISNDSCVCVSVCVCVCVCVELFV